jgi:preprotein translocase subunit SecA
MCSAGNSGVCRYLSREKADVPRKAFDLLWHESAAYYLARLIKNSASYEKHADAVESHAEYYRQLSQDELIFEVARLRLSLKKKGLVFDSVAEIFALIRECGERYLGMYHYRSQLIGGWVMLDGMIAEMETGEGKTFMATLPAVTAALAGMQVHIITVNDYLANRDCEWMRPLYEGLGVSVAAIRQSMTPAERRAVYESDVVYCTNKEIVFDYLKDHLKDPVRRGPAVLAVERLCNGETERRRITGGLCFAIVDEADSVFIDEAVTPLVISGAGNTQFEQDVYATAVRLAGSLKKDISYTVDRNAGVVELTSKGCSQLERCGREIGGLWASRRQSEVLLVQALRALHLFQRDRHYVVADDQVQIIDVYTGRILEGRSWENHLHQMIECKEGCPITGIRENLARITYQRFFRRYQILAGMTGTAREVRRELWNVYSLPVVRIPSRLKNVRRKLKTHLYLSEQEKFSAILNSVKHFHTMGRPVLIGTPVLAVSERLALLFRQHGLKCSVLNALQDKHEAEVIALAGHKGMITVATNMAGRGTDILLGPGVKELGGLHVIATEMHTAARIDRQLFGRCGRQGDPGSYQMFVSLEDQIFAGLHKLFSGDWLKRWVKPWSPLCRVVLLLLAKILQSRLEYNGGVLRRMLLSQDKQLEKALGLSGKGE